MANTANAIAEVNTDDVKSAPVEASQDAKPPEPPQMDEFGRDESERTVILESQDAEFIDREVIAGEHDTYDDALHYVITRGLAEIKRTRDAADKARADKVKLAKMKSWKALLELNPALVADPNIVGKMMTELGMLKQASTK